MFLCYSIHVLCTNKILCMPFEWNLKWEVKVHVTLDSYIGISCKNTLISFKRHIATEFGVKRHGQVNMNDTWKWMHEQIGDNKVWYQNAAKALHNEHINIRLDRL